MPAVWRDDGARFFCFSNDGAEPPCIHVVRGAAHAKFWLIPPHLAHADGFTPAELCHIRHVVEEGTYGFLEAWDRVCG